jgi:hypothetical protein
MVYQYEREGKISRRDGGFDLAEVREQLARNLGTKKGGVPRKGDRQPVEQPERKPAAVREIPTPRAPGRFDAVSKADLEKASLAEQIRKKKRENDVGEGKLADVGKVNAWVAGMIIRAATILDRLPDELADRLSQMTDPVEIKSLLARELSRARTELAEYRAA